MRKVQIPIQDTEKQETELSTSCPNEIKKASRADENDFLEYAFRWTKDQGHQLDSLMAFMHVNAAVLLDEERHQNLKKKIQDALDGTEITGIEETRDDQESSVKGYGGGQLQDINEGGDVDFVEPAIGLGHERVGSSADTNKESKDVVSNIFKNIEKIVALGKERIAEHRADRQEWRIDTLHDVAHPVTQDMDPQYLEADFRELVYRPSKRSAQSHNNIPIAKSYDESVIMDLLSVISEGSSDEAKKLEDQEGPSSSSAWSINYAVDSFLAHLESEKKRFKHLYQVGAIVVDDNDVQQEILANLSAEIGENVEPVGRPILEEEETTKIDRDDQYQAHSGNRDPEQETREPSDTTVNGENQDVLRQRRRDVLRQRKRDQEAQAFATALKSSARL